jgi:hypothetical protein
MEWKFHGKCSYILHPTCVCKLCNAAQDVGNFNLFKEQEDTMQLTYNVLHARLD